MTPTTSKPKPARLSFVEWATLLRWIDGRSLLSTIEPYRLRLLSSFVDERDESGRPRYNVGLAGRGKKNWKTADAIVLAVRAVTENHPAGSQVYLLANDADQARDDLVLAEKFIRANPVLASRLRIKRNVIARRDGRGFIEVLPAQDAVGAHGKTFRLCVFDEVHGLRNWDLFEALAFDPSRPEAQWFITSYASLYHKPGVPLHDLMKVGKAASEPRMLFSWYGGDFTTDPEFAEASPEDRANPSRQSWGNDAYLDQQRRLLPAHKFRRLHLNLPGLPEGSAFQVEPVSDAIERGVTVRVYRDGVSYVAFVDMSGGSSDDAVLSIGHRDGQRCIVDRVLNQGQPAPFDPRLAIERFVGALREYHVTRVTGDRYAGETFRADFRSHGIEYQLAPLTASELYGALEPKLNAHEVVLLDLPTLEQQLLGLVWRGGKIDHPASEHDDHSCSVAGLVNELAPTVTDSITVARTTFGFGGQYIDGGIDVDTGLPRRSTAESAATARITGY